MGHVISGSLGSVQIEAFVKSGRDTLADVAQFCEAHSVPPLILYGLLTNQKRDVQAQLSSRKVEALRFHDECMKRSNGKGQWFTWSSKYETWRSETIGFMTALDTVLTHAKALRHAKAQADNENKFEKRIEALEKKVERLEARILGLERCGPGYVGRGEL